MRTLLLSGAFLVLTAAAAQAAQERCACCEAMAEGQAMVCCEDMAEGEPCCCDRMNAGEEPNADHSGHDAPADSATGPVPAT